MIFLLFQVSATFAASLVTSPALGAYISQTYSEDVVVALATAVAILDVLFILVAVPESLPEKIRPTSQWGVPISWEQADPFVVRKYMPFICASIFLFYFFLHSFPLLLMAVTGIEKL